MKKKHKRTFFLLIIFLITFLIYRATSAGKTPFDYFIRLAEAFTKGRFHILNVPPHLTEIIPTQTDGGFVVYPPMPAILFTIPVLVFGPNLNQEILSQIMGAAIGIFTYLISLKIKKSTRLALFSYLLICFGSIVWYLSSVGSSWYLGQISACFFITWAIYESLYKKRPFYVGVLLGAAYLSRINVIVSIPFFLYLFRDKGWFNKYFKIALGILPFVLFNFLYNYIRFGTIFDKAYFLLPSILNEENTAWFIRGVINLSYIPNNLKAMFWTFPILLRQFPYIQPSWAGLAIWITTPAFIFSFWAKLKERDNYLNLFTWVSIFLIFLIVASHGGTGWAQFGYRFAVDFYPFLTFLTIKGIAKQKGPGWYHWTLLIFGVIVNLWGVLWINKFGWVGW